MKSKIKSLFTFLKLIDKHDGQLSLTNVAVIVVVTKMALAPVASITDVGTLFITLLAYSSKKVINNRQKNAEAIPVDTSSIEKTINSAVSEIESLKSRVSSMALSAGLKSKI